MEGQNLWMKATSLEIEVLMWRTKARGNVHKIKFPYNLQFIDKE